MAWAFVRPADRDLLRGRPLLDLGTGDGQTLAALCDVTGLVVGADRSLPALGANRSGARLLAASASALPLRAASFAVVLAADLFHHLDDAALEVVLHECRRVLAGTGRLVAWWYRRAPRPAPDAPRFPRSYEDVRDALTGCGFEAAVLALRTDATSGPGTAGVLATPR